MKGFIKPLLAQTEIFTRVQRLLFEWGYSKYSNGRIIDSGYCPDKKQGKEHISIPGVA
jgi:hypothetical protein